MPISVTVGRLTLRSAVGATDRRLAFAAATNNPGPVPAIGDERCEFAAGHDRDRTPTEQAVGLTVTLAIACSAS